MIKKLKFQWGSCSINTKANIGSNDGKKLINKQKINIFEINKNINKKKMKLKETAMKIMLLKMGIK